MSTKLINPLIYLPDDLLHQILAYCNISDRVEFARINVGICTLLMTEAREIYLYHFKQIKLLLQSNSFREKLLSVVKSPLRQLSLYVVDDRFESLQLQDVDHPVWSFSLIDCSLDVYRKLNRYHVYDVRSVALSIYPNDNDFISDPDFLLMFRDKPSLTSLSLVGEETLDITNMREILPVIPQLQTLNLSFFPNLNTEGLHISAHVNLKYLSLECCDQIRDVDCLDAIYDLRIDRCNGIRDISALNHNYRITIRNCYGIKDYSKSFHFSQHITIQISPHPTYKVKFIAPSMSDLLQVQTFRLEVNTTAAPAKEFPLPPVPTSLRSLKLRGVVTSFTLADDHQLRELQLDFCLCSLSCANIGSIYKVSLDRLEITSLEGFTERNRIVTICKCPNIADFSPLRNCIGVKIDGCQMFKDASVLKGVRVLHVVLHASDEITNLNGVTHLEIDMVDPIPIYPILSRYNSISKLFLHILALGMPFNYHEYLPPLLSSVGQCKHLKTIVIREGAITSLVRELLNGSKIVNNAFELHKPFGSVDIILKRKEGF